MNKAKFFTVTGLMATSMVAVGTIVASGSSIHFIQATNKKTIDIVPLLANAIAEGSGDFLDEYEVSLNGISYKFEVCDVSVAQSGTALSIGPGGFIRNVTAFNGLAVDAFTTSDSDISNFAVSVGEFSEIETGYGEIDFQNCLSGSSIVGGTYTDENICLVNNGSTSKVITSFKMSHNCTNGDGNVKSDVNLLSWDEEMYFNASGSDGSSDHPYLINGFAAYEAFADMTTRGNLLEDACFELTSDLDYASAERICPVIGPIDTKYEGTGFGGSFNGNNKTICINQFYDVNEAVFGFLTESGSVCNLNVSGTIQLMFGSSNNGGICGWSDGKIEGCSADVTFISKIDGMQLADISFVGGIVGNSTGSIIDCKSNVKFNVNNPLVVGGICGYGEGKITNCSFSGEIHATGDGVGNIGGIAGELDAEWDKKVMLSGAILDYPHNGYLFGFEENGYCGRSIGCYYEEEDGENYQDKIMYFNPDMWDVGDVIEDYYIFRWGNPDGGAWLKLPFDSASNLYTFQLSDVYDATGFLLARVDGGKEPNWGDDKGNGKTVWNQTENLTLNLPNNKITITSWTGGTDGKSSVSWSVR